MKATFENSINVLIQAYLNDTLVHGNCKACAVGNLVAHACGYNYDFSMRHLTWVIEDNHNDWYNNVVMGEYTEQGAFQINQVGYSNSQLLKIETAFETYSHSEGDAMFNGLLAVFHVLAKIHNIDLETKDRSIKDLKEAFAV